MTRARNHKFNWNDYLVVAEHILHDIDNTSIEEGVYRAAISRAYYSSFIPLSKIVEQKSSFSSFKASRKSQKLENHSHQIVHLFLETRKDRKLQRLGRKLERLRILRNFSDYDEKYLVEYDEAEESIVKTKNILDELNKEEIKRSFNSIN